MIFTCKLIIIVNRTSNNIQLSLSTIPILKTKNKEIFVHIVVSIPQRNFVIQRNKTDLCSLTRNFPFFTIFRLRTKFCPNILLYNVKGCDMFFLKQQN